MRAGWNEIFAAHRRAPQFSAFLRGVDVTLPTGEKLNLKIESIQPLPAANLFQLFPYAYATDMKALGFKDSGCAEAGHPLIAIQKSISEAAERCLFRSLRGSRYGTSTSNGWAAHFSRDKAELSALMEILERDAVLVHALREIPFLEIRRDSFPAWLLEWERRELGHTVFSRLRILLSTAGHFPSISAAFVSPEGYGVIAHATAQNLDVGLIRAMAETCRLARIALSGSFKSNSAHLFSKNDRVPVLGPCEQAVVYAHHHPLPMWTFGDPIEWKSAARGWMAHARRFKQNPISYEFVPVLESPITVGYCKSPDVQNLFFGRTCDAERRGELNKNRLGSLKSVEALSALPHFVA